MPILNKKNEEQVNEYNEFVRNFENSSVMQDVSWGNVKKNWIQECVYLKEEEKIVAAVTVRLEKIPILGTYIAYASRGPVCDATNLDLLDKLIKEFEILLDKYKIFVLKFDPEINHTIDFEDKLVARGYRVLSNNVKLDELIQPRYNMILNITNKKEDDIYKEFSEKTRYNVRVAEKKGVTVRYSKDEEDLKKFYEIYKITASRDKIGARSYEYFKDMFDAFDENVFRIYIAEHEGDALAAAIALNYGKKTFYIYGASSNEKRNLMPNYLMQWEMIKWAINTKCNFYDFGGLVTLDKDHGLYRFKMGFCKKQGVTEFIGEIDKVYDRFSYFVFRKIIPFVRSVKFKINRIRKRLTNKM